jgi:hypothetical protein
MAITSVLSAGSERKQAGRIKGRGRPLGSIRRSNRSSIEESFERSFLVSFQRSFVVSFQWSFDGSNMKCDEWSFAMRDQGRNESSFEGSLQRCNVRSFDRSLRMSNAGSFRRSFLMSFPASFVRSFRFTIVECRLAGGGLRSVDRERRPGGRHARRFHIGEIARSRATTRSNTPIV